MNDKEKNRLEWRERVNQFRASGESMTKWCNENNLKVYQLQYWLKKYKDEDSVESNSSTKWVTVSLDDDVWELYNWYFQEMKTPTDYDGADNEDYGNIKVWIGIYHTKEIEVNNRDVFMIVYRGATVPQASDNEQGYTNIFRVTSNIDTYLDDEEDYVLVDYGPKEEDTGETYIISTTIGVTPEGPEASMTISEEITLYKMYINSETNDPNYHAEFNYINERNDYSKSEQYHYGFLIIDTAAND